MRFKVLSVGAVLALAVAGQAQTRSSFLSVDSLQDITVTPSNGGLSYNIAVGVSPKFFYNSTWYNITDVIGFWSLSDDNDLVASGVDQGNFKWNASNSSTGGIAGWKSNPNQGLTPGQNTTLTYTTLDVASVERLGFHVRLDTDFPGTSGNTGFITVETVPEPASILAVGAGLAAFIRKRKSAR